MIKLWEILKERNMMKEDLREEIKMFPATLARLGKNQTVSMHGCIRKNL